MKKAIIISAFLFMLSFTSVTAWLDCAPPSCANEYIDAGISCTGGTCYRNCTIPVCSNNWVQVHSSTCNIDELSDSEAFCQTTSYSPSNKSLCYNFTYQGPPDNGDNILISANTAPSDCDSEAIGGFLDTTGVGNSNPWFQGMGNQTYIGNVGSQNNGDPEFDYLLKIARAHTEEDSTAQYRLNMSGYGEIYCTNNTIACSRLGDYDYYHQRCDTDCYNRATLMHVFQAYLVDKGSPDQTINTDDQCGNSYVNKNIIKNTNNYTVYSSEMAFEEGEPTSCNRVNEAPIATNIMILPLNATAGQDLECNYTYNDTEGYAEQASAYQWWKNGVNQNINVSVLNKANLTIGDTWYCKVAPGDGLMLGTMVQSSNNLTILTTVQNVQMFVGGSSVWQYSNYFWGKNNVLNFTQQLNNQLQSCVADAEGYCTINLTFYSADEGRLNLSKLGIYYETVAQTIAPQYSNILESPTDPTINYSFNAKYNFNITWTDDVSVSIVTLEFDGTNYTSLSQNGNVYGKEFTNLALGTHTYRWYANDTSNNKNSTSTQTYTINQGIHAFDLVNSTGGIVAWFGHLGHLVSKYPIQQNSNYQIASDDLFVIRNSGQDVFIVAKNGTVYIDGTLNQNQPSLNSSDSSNDFRIRNGTSMVSYVNNTGHLFLTQSIIESGIN